MEVRQIPGGADTLQITEATSYECPVGWWIGNGSRHGLVVNQDDDGLLVRWMLGAERDQLSDYAEHLPIRHLHGDAVFARNLAELDDRFDVLDEEEMRGCESWSQMTGMFRKIAETTDVERLCAFFEGQMLQCIRIGAIAERARAIREQDAEASGS